MTTKIKVRRGRSLPSRLAIKNALETLKYNPLERIVQLINKLESELEKQEERRLGKVVDLRPNGKPMYYNEEVHYGLYDKLIKANSLLLPYTYPVAKEEIVEDAGADIPKRAITIQLTKSGEEFVIGDSYEELDDEEELTEEEKELKFILDNTRAVVVED